jgi:hypothetical protein
MAGDLQTPGNEREFWATRTVAAMERQALPGIEKDRQYRLVQLADMFGFNAFETDLLATLWVTLYSNKLKNQLVLFDPMEARISPMLVSELYGDEPTHRLGSESPLKLWDMVHEHELIDGSIALTVDPQIVAWLNGSNELDRILVGKVSVLPGGFEFEAWDLEQKALTVQKQLENGNRCRVILDTDDYALAKAYAEKLAEKLGLLTLNFQGEELNEDDYTLLSVHLHRQAFLDRCAPFFSARHHKLSRINGLTVFPVQFIHGTKAKICETDLKDLFIDVPALTAAHRRQLWLDYLPASRKWKSEQFDDLVWRFDLSASEIIKIANRDPASPRKAAALIRKNVENDLGNLAQKLETNFTWDDLVLPESVALRLQEIVFEAKERARLWSNAEACRIFPQGRGLVALLSGPPGSGKSMAAQVIAAELGLDLLRVDLSAVVSKWVGETAENLQKILSSKMSQRAVLFFDEADALYSKRVDDVKTAQDKYSNMDSGHLMVALENFDGIILMATNLKANIDPAFIRRIRHTVDFKKPTEQARNEIWRKVLSALFGEAVTDSLQTEITRLSQIEATGAQIKNAALSSVFAVNKDNGQLTIELLGNMLTRELAKDGKGISERDLKNLVGG